MAGSTSEGSLLIDIRRIDTEQQQLNVNEIPGLNDVLMTKHNPNDYTPINREEEEFLENNPLIRLGLYDGYATFSGGISRVSVNLEPLEALSNLDPDKKRGLERAYNECTHLIGNHPERKTDIEELDQIVKKLVGYTATEIQSTARRLREKYLGQMAGPFQEILWRVDGRYIKSDEYRQALARCYVPTWVFKPDYDKNLGVLTTVYPVDDLVDRESVQQGWVIIRHPNGSQSYASWEEISRMKDLVVESFRNETQEAAEPWFNIPDKNTF